MKSSLERLIRFVWIHKLYERDHLQISDGRDVIVIEPGQADYSNHGVIVRSAVVQIGDTINTGSLIFSVKSSDWRTAEYHLSQVCNETILHIVYDCDTVVCRADGSVVPTLKLNCSDKILKRYEKLMNYGGASACGPVLASYSLVERSEIFTRLTIERLERKCNDFMMLYEESGRNWNEVFYVMLFRYIGQGSNQKSFIELARRVTYTNISRVKDSHTAVEALLLGGAGLLDVEFADEYTIRLQNEFDHLRRRFNITPLHRNDWNVTRQNPNRHPIVRLVELAALLSSKEFLFSKLIECTTPKDVGAILMARASEYWDMHYLPGKISVYSPKSIGTSTVETLCINLVVPMMFIYGQVSLNDDLKDRALDLLELTKFEKNERTLVWQNEGVKLVNGFFSQGLLQLTNEYCSKKRCTECNIGTKLLCSE